MSRITWILGDDFMAGNNAKIVLHRAVAAHVAFRRSSPEHPMQKHYPSRPELRRVCKAFRIGRYVSTHRRLGGMFAANVAIRTTKGSYVVRVMSGYATARHLKYEKHVLYSLRNAGVPVVFPLKHQSGRRYAKVGNRYVQVTRFVSADTYNESPTQIISSGRILRRFHDALMSSPRGPKPAWSNYPASMVMKKGLIRLQRFGIPSQYMVVCKLYDRIMGWWRNVRTNLPKSVIHGDWHLWNQLYKPNGNVCCVLDFDFVQRGERLLDVGNALWHLLSNPKTRSLSRYFLSGYGRLTPKEYRALPAAVAVASLYELCTRPLMKEPLKSFRYAFMRQIPFLKWLLSRVGLKTVRSLY